MYIGKLYIGYECLDCLNKFEEPKSLFENVWGEFCPKCGSSNIHYIDDTEYSDI